MPHPNHRLVKIHRSYTVHEVARLFSVHRNTVREWIRRGLPTVDRRRPTLIVGRALVAFLKDRREKRKVHCGPDELYCVRCRAARRPVGDHVLYAHRTVTLGTLTGVCPVCAAAMNRTINPGKFGASGSKLVVTPPMAEKGIGDSRVPIVNGDFG